LGELLDQRGLPDPCLSAYQGEPPGPSAGFRQGGFQLENLIFTFEEVHLDR
jgi:hypothetical protein